MTSCKQAPRRATGGCLLAPLLALALASADADALVASAKASHSAGVAMVVDDKVQLDEEWSDKPANVQSITKLFTAVAIALLIQDGQLQGYDAPLSSYFPEWKGTPKGAITLRQVMEHSSGLREPAYDALMDAPDAIAFAAAQPLVAKPGAQHVYSNAAVALLARVIERASSSPEDRYLDLRVFKPLGIESWSWAHDASGHPHAWEGLSLSARDLAKFGAWLASHPPRGYFEAMRGRAHGLLIERPSDALLLSAGARGNLLLISLPKHAAIARTRGSPGRDDFDAALMVKLLR